MMMITMMWSCVVLMCL